MEGFAWRTDLSRLVARFSDTFSVLRVLRLFANTQGRVSLIIGNDRVFIKETAQLPNAARATI